MRDNQYPKASGNGLSTLHKKGRDPPDDSLEDIAEDLISYFKEFSLFEQYEKEIVKKYDVKKEHDDCWPVDDIKRAWGKTQRMYETSKRRKCWSLAVMVQMMKRCSSYDESKRQKTLSDPHEDSGTNIIKQKHISNNGDTQSKRREPAADSDSLETKRKKINREKTNKSDLEQTHINNAGTVYIHVPFSEMFGHTSSLSSETAPRESLPYKLKDKVPSFTEITKKTSYVMLYDNRTRNAAWGYEILNKSIVEENKKNKHLKRSSFKVDDSIPKPFQTPEGKKPYKKLSQTPEGEKTVKEEKPIDRGHLIPARNHRSSQKAKNDTYLLCNISPQSRGLNRGIWKTLENRCLEIANEEKVRNVHVYTGPLYPSDDDHSQHVEYEFVGGKTVPSHFFKVIIVEKEDGTVLQPTCYKIPNEELEDKKVEDDETELPKEQLKCRKKVSKTKSQNKDELAKFEVDIEDIERESGLIFTDRRCEEETTDKIWTVKEKNKPQKYRPDITVRISTTLSDPAGF